MSRCIARGLALFLGGFSLLNLAGELKHPGFDANLWWIDLRMLGPVLSRGLLGATSLLLITWGIRPARGSPRRIATGIATALLLAAAVGNAVVIRMLAGGQIIATDCPISFSLLIAIALAWILAAVLFSQKTPLPTGYGLSRVLAVSHFHHLPRIKLAYQRHGQEVYTVPARETRRLKALPAYMLREIAALLFYYVRPLA